MSRLGIPAAALAPALIVFGAAAVQAAPVTVGARIVEVTVFADRAEITREGRVDLAAGPATLSFAGLPWNVEPDSLRVTAKGTPVALGAVELKERVAEPAMTPELLAAQAEVERLDAALRSVASERKTDQSLREFLDALKATTATRESERMGEGKADPASILAAYTLLRNSLLDLGKDAVARDDRTAKLSKDLELARAKLASLRQAGPIRSRDAMVEVEAERAGSLTVRLSYLAPGASWRPAYRASLDAATGAIVLGSEAVVRQSFAA